MERGAARSIVVGGAGHLGAEILRLLRERGDRVLCLDRVAPETVPSDFIPLDVTDAESTRAAIATAEARLGRLDVLIHTVGLLRTNAFLEISADEMREHLNVNLMGAFHVAQAVAEKMKDRGGRIVLVTSIHGQVGVPNRGAYAASKGGVAALARVMAAELAKYRIRVNVLAPGALEGGMTPDPCTRSGWTAATPSCRVAQVEEAARAAAMLSSDEASFINGQIVAVDGGASTLRLIPA